MFDGNCEIRRAGFSPEGMAQLGLRSMPTFDWTWFLSSPEHSREILAIGLTAIASDKMVACQINDPVAPWAQIIRCVLVK